MGGVEIAGFGEREALAKRATAATEDLMLKTKDLGELKVGQEVRVQNQAGDKPKHWDNTGVVVESKGFDQYVVKNDGSGRLTMRNRQFLKPIIPYGKSSETTGADSETTQSRLFDASPGPSSGLDYNTFVEEDKMVSRGQRLRKTPDRLQVTGRGQSYESQLVQSVCQTSFTQVLGGGGGHQGDWAGPSMNLGCAFNSVYNSDYAYSSIRTNLGFAPDSDSESALRAGPKLIMRLTQEDLSKSSAYFMFKSSPHESDDRGGLGYEYYSHQAFGRVRVKLSSPEAELESGTPP